MSRIAQMPSPLPSGDPKRSRRAARSYSPTTLKVLFSEAGNLCAYPRCNNRVVMPETEEGDQKAVQGDIAHIIAASPDGPRADPSFPRDQLAEEKNLIVLCGYHHKLVDTQPLKYTADMLRRWKHDHSTRVHARRRRTRRLLHVGATLVASTAAVATGAGIAAATRDPGSVKSGGPGGSAARGQHAVKPLPTHFTGLAKAKHAKEKPVKNHSTVQSTQTTSGTLPPAPPQAPAQSPPSSPSPSQSPTPSPSSSPSKPRSPTHDSGDGPIITQSG